MNPKTYGHELKIITASTPNELAEQVTATFNSQPAEGIHERVTLHGDIFTFAHGPSGKILLAQAIVISRTQVVTAMRNAAETAATKLSEPTEPEAVKAFKTALDDMTAEAGARDVGWLDVCGNLRTAYENYPDLPLDREKLREYLAALDRSANEHPIGWTEAITAFLVRLGFAA